MVGDEGVEAVMAARSEEKWPTPFFGLMQRGVWSRVGDCEAAWKCRRGSGQSDSMLQLFLSVQLGARAPL